MNTKPFSILAVLCAALFAQTSPAQIAPVLPSIATNNIFNITTYGATTGSSDNSTAIQAAIVAAAAASGGGTVEIPAGTYLSGPIALKSKVNLQVDAGATLEFLAESSYPNATGSPAYPIAGTNLTDVEISGAGTIDGNGAGWWAANPSNRPYMIYLNKTQRVLIQGVTLQNPPKMHIVFKNWMGNITIQGITINTTNNSPNTDGIDLIGTNCLIQDCHISAGDDNIAIGSSSATAYSANILVTNCSFGAGHGMTIGSSTYGGVSNLTVINCSFNGTACGIRMKSDNASSGGGTGGTAQSLYYYNLTMTNIGALNDYYPDHGMPILINSYYNTNDPVQGGASLSTAAAKVADPVSANTPVWRDIIISNLTVVTTSGSVYNDCLIWGRKEMPVTNLILANCKIGSHSGDQSPGFGIYNAYGVQIIDSSIATPTAYKTLTLYNAGVTISNSTTATSAITLDGRTGTNTLAPNSLALYNAFVNIGASDLYGANPVTVSGGVLSNSTSLTLPSTTVVNFALGTIFAGISVNGSLTLNSPTLNISDGGGFGAGTYTLFSYTSGSLTGTPVLGTTPPGYNYSLSTSVANKVNLIVTSTNLTGVKPAITNQPASQNFYLGQNATLVAGANGTAPLACQWFHNTNSLLATATNLSLVLTNLQTTNAGTYDVVVTNAYGAVTSAVATLTVALPPKFATATAGGSGLVLAGTGGLPGSNYVVLATTNVALPSSQWTRLTTNPFNGSGNFSFTNNTTTNPQSFFRLLLP